MKPSWWDSMCMQRRFRQCACRDDFVNVHAETISSMCMQGRFRQCACRDDFVNVHAETISSMCMQRRFRQCACRDDFVNVHAETISSMCMQRRFRQCACRDDFVNVHAETISSMCMQRRLCFTRGGGGGGGKGGGGAEWAYTIPRSLCMQTLVLYGPVRDYEIVYGCRHACLHLRSLLNYALWEVLLVSSKGGCDAIVSQPGNE